jgi:hypothetical protein
MRIRIQILLCGSVSGFLIAADADPTFHPDADPDPDPTFHLMRIRFQVQLFCADPDPAKAII